jgi:phage host-nuclease inhibitor protein Gam
MILKTGCYEIQKSIREIHDLTRENKNPTREIHDLTCQNKNPTPEIQNPTRQNQNSIREIHDLIRQNHELYYRKSYTMAGEGRARRGYCQLF